MEKNKKRKSKTYFGIYIWISLGLSFFIGILVGGGISHIHLLNGQFEEVERRGLIDPVEYTLQHYTFDSTDSSSVNEFITFHQKAKAQISHSMNLRNIYLESLFHDTAGKSNSLYLLRAFRRGQQSKPKRHLDFHKELDSVSEKILRKNLKNSLKAEIVLIPDYIEKAVAKQQHEYSE
ncbi:MAG: hypothetical protein EOO85_17265 [Pedobacter sp.]|nr:MAG: hypothetical protein EOO85_17265 [Pedobacter sp.]